MSPAIYWLPAALMSLVCYGLWGFFSKLAIQNINAKSALVYQSIGFTLIGFLTLLLLHYKPDVQLKGVGYGLLAGVATAVGSLFFLIAADRGKVSTIVTLTALYPIITIFLAYVFLKEGINLRQSIGIVMALIAIRLLS
tara:strand:+ start:1174 stop:1590 length:417 start_codon:yes stop_codon:yes gene_type:complete